MYTTLERTKTQLTLTHVTAVYKKSSAAVLTCRMVFACVRVCRVSQHEGRCHWLNDDKFLRDLESDSVDSETLDEELRSLELQETNT